MVTEGSSATGLARAYFTLSGRTSTGFTVQFFDATTNAAVSRVFDWLAMGH
jgi:hypothetical protein